MFKDNLKTLIKRSSMNVEEFSQIVEIKTATIYNYRSGDRQPDMDTLLLIKQKYLEKTGKNINLDWLISGEGEMFITQQKSSPVITSDELDKKVNESIMKALKQLGLN